jgi:hypothetical protein
VSFESGPGFPELQLSPHAINEHEQESVAKIAWLFGSWVPCSSPTLEEVGFERRVRERNSIWNRRLLR